MARYLTPARNGSTGGTNDATALERWPMTDVLRRLHDDLRQFHPALDRPRAAMLLALQTSDD